MKTINDLLIGVWLMSCAITVGYFFHAWMNYSLEEKNKYYRAKEQELSEKSIYHNMHTMLYVNGFLHLLFMIPFPAWAMIVSLLVTYWSRYIYTNSQLELLRMSEEVAKTKPV